MRYPWLLALLGATVLGGRAGAAEVDSRIRVLVITGGHGFEKEPFFRLFKDNAEIVFTAAEHGKDSATAYERADLLEHQVVVLYDMPRNITDQQKARLLS